MLDKLFDFQLEDVKKLADRRGRLIANDPGTGKTYEGIALDFMARTASADLERVHTLVVAPKTVLGVWEEHFNRLAPDLVTVVIDPKRRQDFLKTPGHVFILHWEALRLLQPELVKIQWLHIIADECHRMKNRKAQMTQAIKKIPTIYKTAMSGTPIVNRPDEGWSVLNWLYPQQYRSFWKFYQQYVDFEIQYPQGYHKIKGPKNLEQLHEQIAPYFVRRLKEDVLKDLPPKYYTDIYVELDPKQRKAYNDMFKDLLAWVGENEDKPLVAPIAIAKLTRLQQFSCASCDIDDDGKVFLTTPSSKLDAVMSIVTESHADQQLVIFSHFKQMVNLICKELAANGITYVTLTGDDSAEERTASVDSFQSGIARILVGTIQAGGVGITLTAASTVVFTDRTWSPAMNSQAEDRLHRHGQTNAVQVIDIMAHNTVDHGHRQMLELKWDWIKRFLGDI